MAYFAVVKPKDDDENPGLPFGPFVNKDEAENWANSEAEFLRDKQTDLFEVDDYIAFGPEVN